MDNKKKLLNLIPLVTAFVAISSCGAPAEEKYSPYRLNSSGVSNIYNSEAPTYEDSPIEKKELNISYQDLFDNYIYQADNIPSKGDNDAKMLIIPIWFNDSSLFVNEEYKEPIRNDIKNVFFGDEEDTGWRSVSGYYRQESFNKFNLTGSVTEWYECGKSFEEYCLLDDNTKSQENTSNLVKEAFEWFKNNNSDYASFDSDKDGYIDSISLIYAAPDYETFSRVNGYRIGNNMWAYSFWKQDAVKNKNDPIVNGYLWASYDFMYNKKNPKYTLYGYGDTNHCKVDTHTFIHETGHLLGLQDYYDYGTTYGVYGSYSAAGYFSMQDNNVGGHDPYSKIALGWIKPYVVDYNSFEGDSITLNIRPNQETGDVILITPEFHDSPFDEYLLIELYTPTGLNKFDTDYAYLNNALYQGSKESGCRLWHVDARLASPNGKTGTGSNKSYYYSDNPTIVTDPKTPTTYGKEHATSNTTKDAKTKGYYTEVTGFQSYRLLQLIRQGKNNTTCGDSFSKKDLFQSGDLFSTRLYTRIFSNRNIFPFAPCLMNNENDFKFAISFDSVTAELATITISKII